MDSELRNWILEPNAFTDEEVKAHLDAQRRANAAAGGPCCPVCGKYLALHGEEHEFEDSTFS